MALGAVHTTYPVIAGRFKDYISTPKSNGYQSLHTCVTLREPRNQKIEVQIRTRAMHEVAEAGVAAHWLYKEGRAETDDVQHFRWVQDLLEILENSSAPDAFLENTKLELYEDQVFCFTPKGRLIQLPRGATPVDFAYAVHSQVGDSCVGAKVNGQLKPLRHELQNGDQVEIMTARGGTPSPQWYRFVVTGKARARIRRFIHQQERQRYLDEGRAALAKAFRQNGLDGQEKVLEGTLKALKQTGLDALYIAVGNARPEPERGRARRLSRDAPRCARAQDAAGLARAQPRASAQPESEMPIRGLISGMVVHYAGCCHPLPGDPIVGIVTTGKGVTIHTRDCQTLETFAATPQRFRELDGIPRCSPRKKAAPPTPGGSTSSPPTARRCWRRSRTPSPSTRGRWRISRSSIASTSFPRFSWMSRYATSVTSRTSSPACAARRASPRSAVPAAESFAS